MAEKQLHSRGFVGGKSILRDWEEQLKKMPVDDRTPQQRLVGDPPTQRSALYQRLKQEAEANGSEVRHSEREFSPINRI